MNRTVVACSLFAATLAFATSATAQSAAARRFLPQGYKTVLNVDFAKVRTCGVWDDLEASLLKSVFRRLKAVLGSPVEHIDQITMVFEVPEEAAARGRAHNVLAIDGNAPLGTPDDATTWSVEQKEGRVVRRQGDDVLVLLADKLLVRGEPALVDRGLAEDGKQGLPDPEVMSLLTGRGDRLVSMVFDLANREIGGNFRRQLFPEAEWPADDEPRALALQVRCHGDADDPQLELLATLRHGRAGKGLDVTAEQGQRWLAKLSEIPQLRGIKKQLAAVEAKREGTDFIARLALGRSREAVGTFAVIMAAMLQGTPLGESHQVEREPPPPPQLPRAEAEPK